MSVYNGEKYLTEAIDSILQQTFTDFEFLIINDASEDNSVNIITSYKDHRIKLVHNQENLGLAKSLNKGIKLSQGKYIARMDADDISLPERLKIQYTFMEENPNIGVCGSWVIQKKVSGEQIAKCAEYHEDIIANMLFNNCIAHPTAFIRKDIIIHHQQFYNENFRSSQDYEYWVRLSRFCCLYNLQRPLVNYRKHEESVSFNKSYKQTEFTNQVRLGILNQLGIKPTKCEFETHVDISRKVPPQTNTQLAFRKKWLAKIRAKNKTVKLYHQKALSNSIRRYWWFSVNSLECYSIKSLAIIFFNTPLSWLKIELLPILKIVIKCFVASCKSQFNMQ